MEAMKLQKQVPVTAMLDPKIVIPAIGSAFAKLRRQGTHEARRLYSRPPIKDRAEFYPTKSD